MTQYVK